MSKTPIDVACSHTCYSFGQQNNCSAGVGEPCNWSMCDVDQIGTYHFERRDAADFINAIESGRDVSMQDHALEKQAIDKIAEDEVL